MLSQIPTPYNSEEFKARFLDFYTHMRRHVLGAKTGAPTSSSDAETSDDLVDLEYASKDLLRAIIGRYTDINQIINE